MRRREFWEKPLSASVALGGAHLLTHHEKRANDKIVLHSWVQQQRCSLQFSVAADQM